MLRIKEVCAKKGTTLLALSKKIGIAQPALSRVANGVTKPTLETLERIAAGLDVPVAELLTPPSDFVALVRRGGELYSFDSEEELFRWLCPDALPVTPPGELQDFLERKGKYARGEQGGGSRGEE